MEHFTLLPSELCKRCFFGIFFVLSTLGLTPLDAFFCTVRWKAFSAEACLGICELGDLVDLSTPFSYLPCSLGLQYILKQSYLPCLLLCRYYCSVLLWVFRSVASLFLILCAPGEVPTPYGIIINDKVQILTMVQSSYVSLATACQWHLNSIFLFSLLQVNK